MFPSPGACLAPSWSHLKPWGTFSPAPSTLCLHTSYSIGGGESLESSPILPPFPGPPAPNQISSVRVPKELGNLCLPHCTNRDQGPEMGRDLPGVTQQRHQDPGPRGSVASFNRRDALFPYLRDKGGETPGPGGRASSVCTGSVPASFSHWNAALSTAPQFWAPIQGHRQQR